MWFVTLSSIKRYPPIKALPVLGVWLFFALIHIPASAARLRAGFALPSLNVTMLWITQEGKLCEKNGVNVEALYLESTLA